MGNGMNHALNDLSSLALDDLLSMVDGEQVSVASVDKASAAMPVAIVGMAGRIGGCRDLDAFWTLLRDGRTTRRPLPDCRREDLQRFLRLKGAFHSERPVEYFRASFLSDIDKFDHHFFGLAKQEANFTDPNQRLFLETAWTALEHAGYAGSAVRGTSTGVFLGFSADFGDAYRDIVRTLAPDAPEVAVVGNVKSMMASRIAYQLDLHGPSMLVDTACSSGLVALHLACRALAAGDCDMALAGAVKLDLVPVADDPTTGVGIKDIQATGSRDGLTRTFDDGAEGTSGAEGVIAFVLKPLARALADGDTVHAVVMGSAVNQDGLSVGITAPNMAAQEALIVRALRNAGVNPDTISYIEAHGTGTSLGDPIEVSGIRRAFEHYTARRQFCAIGSVKTNVGHLDNAAGLAGLAKVAMAMRHAQIPASLNFEVPNRRVAFEQAAVYVNDALRPWLPPPGSPMRAGVSSFGLSGTNCHVIVEQAPAQPSVEKKASYPCLLPLSASTEESLRALLEKYRDFLRDFDGRAGDLCFTAAAGRAHREYRVSLRFEHLDELRAQIDALLAQGMDAAIAGARYGAPRARSEGDTGETERDAVATWLSRWRAGDPNARAALMTQAQALYAQGADLDWRGVYADRSARRIPLPTYPFASTRCWASANASGEHLAMRGAAKTIAHPLLDRCLAQSLDLTIHDVTLGADSHWELADHEVRGRHVLPGVCFIEMLLESAAHGDHGRFRPSRIEGLTFMRPLSLEAGERRIVQLVLQGPPDVQRACILSRAPGNAEWEVHAEGLLRPLADAPPAPLDLDRLRSELSETVQHATSDDAARGLRIGDRWNLSVQGGWVDPARERFLIQLALPPRFAGDLGRYHFHPALIDNAVNAANHLLGDEGLYLPFSYGRFEAFAPLPPSFHVHLRRHPGGSREAYRFDLECVDDTGRVVALARDYTVRYVSEKALEDAADPDLQTLTLAPADDRGESAAPLRFERDVLLIGGGPGSADASAAVSVPLEALGASLTRIAIGADHVPQPLGQDWNDRRFGAIVYAAGAGEIDTAENLLGFVRTLRDLERHRIRCDGPLLVLVRGAFALPGADADPAMAALAALARIAGLENPQSHIRCLDTDRDPDAEILAAELVAEGRDLSLYRDGVRYAERLESLPLRHTAYRPRSEGVYLITGGLGALGMAAAQHIARKGAVRLALLSANALPPRAEWDDVDAPRSRNAIAGVRALETLGAEVECIAADVADTAAMAAILDGLRARHGSINGVIHAAGRAGDGFLRSKPDAEFRRVLAPKIDGARALDTLTADDDLEFFVLYSSVATVLRSAGQGDYTAGNAYLDALAQRRRARGRPAVSLCWPAWREIGIAVDYGAVDENEFFAPINTDHALALLESALTAGDALPPTVLPARVNQRADAATLDALGISLPEPVRSRLRRAAAQRGAAQAPQGEHLSVVVHGIDEDAEVRDVAGLWAKVLGIAEFGADDAFADHGGNSILTTQLYREYERLHAGAVDVVDLFSAVSIRDQAELLRKRRPSSQPRAATREAPRAALIVEDDELDSVLARLAQGSLSAEEAQALLE